MPKLNWTYRIATLLLFVTGSCNAMGKNDTKFEWRATESAPKHYPMEIIQGTFFYHSENEGLYIPSGGTLRGGWGQGISNHHGGEKLKPLPDRLKIIFFSYAEKQFYKGEFDLPYEKILALFRDGVTNATVYRDGSTRQLYSSMMVGIAPGGAVAVWANGQRVTEVFFGQANKIDLDPSRAFALPFANKMESDAYMAEGLVEALRPEELESLKKEGIPFGLWSRYRNHYNWRPTATEGHSLKDVDVTNLNGEFFGEWVLGDSKDSMKTSPVPSEMSFRSTNRVLYTITFDEFETMDAFEKLGKYGQRVYLGFEPRIPRADIKVRVYNGEESIELKKFVSKK